MRTILVTGAAGLIGKAVCEGLLNKNNKVIGTDRDTVEIENDNFTFVRALITNADAVKKIIKDNKPDAIVHLACSVDNDYPPILTEVQEHESASADSYLYSYAAEKGVKDFILLSSHMVYAPTKSREPVNEQSELKPVTVYGKMKYDSENAMFDALRNTPVNSIVMRCCPIYTKSFTDNLHAKVYDPKEKCAFMYNYGDYGYNFTNLYNLVDFVVCILQQNSKGCQGDYNVCDSKIILAKEIIEFEKANGIMSPTSIVMRRNYGADNAKSFIGKFGSAAKNNKYDYRCNDISTAISSVSYENTKARRFSSFRWNLSNTK